MISKYFSFEMPIAVVTFKLCCFFFCCRHCEQHKLGSILVFYILRSAQAEAFLTLLSINMRWAYSATQPHSKSVAVLRRDIMLNAQQAFEHLWMLALVFSYVISQMLTNCMIRNYRVYKNLIDQIILYFGDFLAKAFSTSQKS